MPTAYSYLRFSSPEQAKGDSIRRQTLVRDKWLAEHPGVTLDTSLKMTDAGRSAFKRTNPETYAIAEFVELVKAGKIATGSYLLLENLDRLSREEAGEATELLLGIVNRGVIVVQLLPTVLEFVKPVNTMSLMFAIVELSRGHSESEAKSKRGREVWDRKQKDAGIKIVTKMLPGWIEVRDGMLVLDESKAVVVRRLFAMTIQGHGHQAVAVVLNREGVPVMRRVTLKGRPVKWSATTVRHILRSRATVGEYVPYTSKAKGRKPQGEPVPGYFPVVVDETTWNAAQGAMRTRAGVGRGRRGKHVNIFAGLLTDARNGGTMGYRHQAATAPVIAPIDALQGRAKWISFPAVPFEFALLSQLREVSVRDVQGEDDVTAKAEAIRYKRDELDKLIAKWTAKMDDPDIVDAVAAKLGELNKQRKHIDAQYTTAAQAAASPIGDTLDEIRTLAHLLLNDNSDENRIRVRTAVRRVVTRVVCALVQKDGYRVANVRVEFCTGRMREYVIIYKKGHPPFVRSGAGPISKTLVVDWPEMQKQFADHFALYP